MQNGARDAGATEYAGLIRRAADGDRGALEGLLMKAQEVAYRFSHAACGGPTDAEDVMQDALVKTFRYVSRIRDPEAFRTWLYHTVRNACLMKRRRKVGQPERILSLDELLPSPDAVQRAIQVSDGGRSPEQIAVNASLRRRLRRAMQGLPPRHRSIVFLRDMEGLSTREVAAVMKMSEANVKTQLHRARLFLRQKLDDER